MARMKAVKFLILATMVGIIAGCKIAVIVVEGGEVQTNGSGTCVASTICIVEVNDTNFSETFTAVPDTGWYFEKWSSGFGFFCGDSTDPICVVSGVDAQGNEDIEAIVESDETFYLMPIFKPNQDIITVDGKEWLQPNLFLGLSWNDINAVCPAGMCSGELNGYDINGWTWASVDDVNALFNYYLGRDELGPGPDSYVEDDSEWAPAFFSDGWLRTNMHEGSWLKAVEGWLSSLHDDQRAEFAQLLYVVGGASELDPRDGDHIKILDREIVSKADDRGGWFYRSP